ncbi:unnamed protein product [Dibothriocephalus latus]|uniref:HTH CENPB-type domain-containing protein n=1 Tax=Dibothriocephalus latus TaxID=60516 RepID=A0A3P7PHF6_DIBLA|nr:unnamed protein product [Dibothriocephalus latus]
MAMVWIFLLRHQFTEAARVLADTIHSYSISPSWLWRFKRDPSSSKEAVLTREPEVNHVQRLQRLYEGLASYALWYEAKVATPDGASLTAKADKAIYRLSEVDALIEDGHVCDIFLRPFIHVSLLPFPRLRRTRLKAPPVFSHCFDSAGLTVLGTEHACSVLPRSDCLREL